MAFRDDREALRAKNEVLEDEVGDLRRALSKAEEALAAQEADDAEDERELAELRREVAALRKRLGIAEPPSPAALEERKRKVMIGLGVAVLAGVGVGLYTSASDRGDAALANAVEPRSESQKPEPTPAPVPPPPIPISRAAYFGAVVVATEGMNATVGDGCVLVVELSEAPREVELLCGAPLHASTLARSTLIFDAGEGAMVDGYALRAQHASVMIDTPRHEILLEPEAGAFTRLYVDAFGIASTDAEPPADAMPVEEDAETDAALAALLDDLEAERACEVSGPFDGRMRTVSGVEARVSLRSSGTTLERTLDNGRVVENVEQTRRELTTPIGTIDGAIEIDCDQRLAVLEDETSRMSARLGPGFATLVGVFESSEGTGTFWMRRTGDDPEPAEVGVEVEATAGMPSDIGGLPPHVQEAVRRALEEAR